MTWLILRSCAVYLSGYKRCSLQNSTACNRTSRSNWILDWIGAPDWFGASKCGAFKDVSSRILSAFNLVILKMWTCYSGFARLTCHLKREKINDTFKGRWQVWKCEWWCVWHNALFRITLSFLCKSLLKEVNPRHWPISEAMTTHYLLKVVDLAWSTHYLIKAVVLDQEAHYRLGICLSSLRAECSWASVQFYCMIQPGTASRWAAASSSDRPCPLG